MGINWMIETLATVEWALLTESVVLLVGGYFGFGTRTVCYVFVTTSYELWRVYVKISVYFYSTLYSCCMPHNVFCYCIT